MARVLRSTVVLRDPASGQIAVLLAGRECPDWAEPLISNPGVLPEPETAKAPAKRTARK